MKNLERLEYLIGSENVKKLNRAQVAVIGLGGVGSVAALALARSGIGALIIQDHDVVQESNINRQLIANYETLGRPKVDVMEEEILKVNPDCRVTKLFERFSTESKLFEHDFQYLIDAIDSVEDKFLLIKEALKRELSFISAMGAAKKTDPSQLEVTSINKTTHDPLARILRRKLREENLKADFMVVSSTEAPAKIPALGSYMPVTATAGLLLADYIIKLITGGMP